MAIGYGLNAPLTDIVNPQLRWAVQTADAITGTDKLGMKFIKESRIEKSQKEDAALAREKAEMEGAAA